jgi:hypothetical protein
VKIIEVKDIDILREWAKGGDHAESQQIKLKEYALIGNDNVVYLFNLETRVIRKLLSADSHAIGFYFDQKLSYYFLLTKNLKFFYYNKSTFTLERIGNYQDACDILCLDEIIESIFEKINKK